jgi:glycosyltransferase involved in cell wall biosynthesis
LVVHFAALPPARADVLRRAIARACEAGASAALAPDGPPDRLMREADVIVSLPWPVTGENRAPALAAMAARKPVIVLETTSTAEWPALDPQTWQPRGFSAEAPIAVSLDPRDEEHSLVLAIQRLSSDPDLRARLGDAAYTWVVSHS